MKKCDQTFELDLKYDVIDDISNLFNTTIFIYRFGRLFNEFSINKSELLNLEIKPTLNNDA